MPIETICQNCARKLRVADEHAGRKARCPHCKNVYTVPQSVAPRSDSGDDGFPTLSSKDASLEASGSPFGTSSSDQWRLRTEDGNVYGPVSKAEVDSWLTEGRITADCHLQQEGSLEWTSATTIYPALARPTAQTSTRNPFADGNPVNPTQGPTPRPTSNPFQGTAFGATPRGRRLRPHRGGLILGLGIASILCCNAIGPVAWALGHTDMSQIRNGIMDPSGKGITQAGMILGIIGTVILIVQVLIGAVGVVAN